MCGLFAIIPTTEISEVFAVKLRFLAQILAKENDSRGGHSWGLWSYDYNPVRGLGDIAIEGLPTLIRFLESWKPKQNGWMAGHTRFGTHGDNSIANAHPFVHGHLTLAHNGIVDVDIKDHDVMMHPVDSGQLCIAISKYGLKESLERTSGSIGLLFNMKDNKLRAYKSGQTLHYAECPWGFAVSSDAYHLSAALHFLGMEGTVKSFTSDMVSAPWNPEFTPFKIEAGLRASKYMGFQSFDKYKCGSRKGKKHSNGKWVSSKNPVLVDSGDGVWTFPEPDVPVKLVKGTKTDKPKVELLYGRYNTPRMVEHPIFHHNIFYEVGKPCTTCSGLLDEEGGFFYDEGDTNRYWACCTKCLDEKAAAGLLK